MKFFRVVFLVFVALCLMGGSVYAQSGKAITLKLSHEMPTTHYGAIWADAFAKKVEEYSKGSIKVAVYPAGQLYKSVDGLQALSGGALDMQMIITSALATIDESFNAVALPYAFKSSEDLANTFNENRELSKTLLAKLTPKGIINVSWWAMTDWPVVNMKRPIKTAEDFKGLKIRTLGGAPQQYAFEALGASTVQLSPTEVLTALAQGTIDGSPITYNYWRYQFTNAKYGTDAGPIYVASYALLVSSKRWGSLSAEQKDAIQKAGDEVAKMAVINGKEIDKAMLTGIEERGGELYRLPAEEMKRWKEITYKAWQHPGLRQKIGEDIMKILEANR